MEIKAKLKYLHISPRKVRMVADLIRGRDVNQAKALLEFTIKRGGVPLKKLLGSAVASARHNFQLEEDNLYISEINVTEGPKLKRYRARSHGQAYLIQKKTSHITLVLREKEEKAKKTPSKGKEPTQAAARAEEKIEKQLDKKEEGKIENAAKIEQKSSSQSLKAPRASEKPTKTKKLERKNKERKSWKKKREKKNWRKVFRRKAF